MKMMTKHALQPPGEEQNVSTDTSSFSVTVIFHCHFDELEGKDINIPLTEEMIYQYGIGRIIPQTDVTPDLLYLGVMSQCKNLLPCLYIRYLRSGLKSLNTHEIFRH
jgi:hypothetical protein